MAKRKSFRNLVVDGIEYRYLIGDSYVNIRRRDNQVSENIPRHQVEVYNEEYDSVSVLPSTIGDWVRENQGSFQR